MTGKTKFQFHLLPLDIRTTGLTIGLWLLWFVGGTLAFPSRRWHEHLLAVWLLAGILPLFADLPDLPFTGRVKFMRRVLGRGIIYAFLLGSVMGLTLVFFEPLSRPPAYRVPGIMLTIFLAYSLGEALFRRALLIFPVMLARLVSFIEFFAGFFLFYLYTLILLDWPGIWIETEKGLILWGCVGLFILLVSLFSVKPPDHPGKGIETPTPLRQFIRFSQGSLFGALIVLAVTSGVNGLSRSIFQPVICPEKDGCVAVFIEPQIRDAPLLALVAHHGRTYVYRVEGNPSTLIPVSREAHTRWAVSGRDGFVWTLEERFLPDWRLRPARIYSVQGYPADRLKPGVSQRLAKDLQPWPPLNRPPVMVVSPQGDKVALALFDTERKQTTLIILGPDGQRTASVKGVIQDLVWMQGDTPVFSIFETQPHRRSRLMIWPVDDTPRPVYGSDIEAFAYPMVAVKPSVLLVHFFRDNAPDGRVLTQYMRIRLKGNVVEEGRKTVIFEGSRLVSMRPGRPVIVERTEKGGFRLVTLSPENLARSQPYLLPPLKVLRYLASDPWRNRLALAVEKDGEPAVMFFAVPEQDRAPLQRLRTLPVKALSLGFLDEKRFVYWDGDRIHEGSLEQTVIEDAQSGKS